MYRRIKLVDPESVYQAKVIEVTPDDHDSLRCGHPRGPTRCTHVIACTACPFAEPVDLDIAA